MASVFKKDDNYIQKQPRNTYDLSCQNNLTTNFGKLVPVFCQEVLPGDSFRIKPTFGLRFLPQVFPVQTRMRAHIHYFYVRNRTLWKDWMDFIGKTRDGLVSPYLNIFSSDLKPSGLHDYLGLPTWLNGESGNVWTAVPTDQSQNKYFDVDTKSARTVDKGTTIQLVEHTGVTLLSKVYGIFGTSSAPSTDDPTTIIANPMLYLYDVPVRIPRFDSNGVAIGSFKLMSSSWPTTRYYLIAKLDNGDIVSFPRDPMDDDEETIVNRISYTGSDGETRVSMVSEVYGYLAKAEAVSGSNILQYRVNVRFQIQLQDYSGLPMSYINETDIPYFNNTWNKDGQRISALPFRAYEAIYNSFYRNAEVTPFMKDGKEEYNSYVTTDEGGLDWTNYYLYNRPWADDRFTTCRVSPQAGDAPLVGLTGVNGATLTLAKDDGTMSTLHLQVDSDTGNVVAVDDVVSDDAEQLKSGMLSAIEYGITISDLRNVNSFQKWLENKNRRGFKYGDQMASHYGVKIRYDVLQMPEFIGGVSRDVSVNQISQTVETSTGNLGDIAGQAGVVGTSETISTFCDEHGFIMGIMSIVPAPMYSQAIPKHLLKNDAFDYFFPEFGKIGYQPILNKELALAQSYFDGTSDEVFGYQRAWSDYLENLDSVHGLFLSDFKNFLLGRVFSETPKLSGDFLYVNRDQLNNIFYVDDDSDKILGQIYHDVKAKRQIPLFGIPQID